MGPRRWIDRFLYSQFLTYGGVLLRPGLLSPPDEVQVAHELRSPDGEQVGRALPSPDGEQA